MPKKTAAVANVPERTPDTHVMFCVRGPHCFGFSYSPGKALKNAKMNLPGFVKDQAKEKKIPIVWDCFEIDPATKFEISHVDGTCSWSPKDGARKRNELIEDI